MSMIHPIGVATASKAEDRALDELAFAQHVMIDIETMGLRAGAPILSIGACQFGRFGIGDTFYAVIDPRSYGTPDMDTICWWMKQSDAARAIFNDPSAKHINVVLSDFVGWFRRPFQYVWSHGASFDPVHLELAYKNWVGQTPWKYNDLRDTRTLYHLADVYPDRSQGTHHNALDDAVAQAEAAIVALNKLGWPDDA